MVIYCWAPAAAGTGIPRALAAEITGEPARGPRGEDVGTEEIPARGGEGNKRVRKGEKLVIES